MNFFSWWLNQPIWKHICQIGSFFPRFRVKINKKIETTNKWFLVEKDVFFSPHQQKQPPGSYQVTFSGANRDLHLGNHKVTRKKLASVCSQRTWNKNCLNRKIIWLWSLLPARGQREISLFQSTGTMFVFYCFLLVGAYKPPPYCNPLLVIS